MGVTIWSEEVALVTNRELHNILHYLMNIDWQEHTPIKNDDELNERMSEYLGQLKLAHGIRDNADLKELNEKLGKTLEGAVIKKFAEYLGKESELDGGAEPDDLYKRSTDFPHWYGRTVWDGTNEIIATKHKVLGFTIPPVKPSSIETVSMSYGYYNHLRERISETFLGVAPRQVWRYKFEQAYKTNNFKRNLYLLIHGSDCEGVIVPDVVHAIASSLCSEDARKIFHENNSEYDNEWFDQLANVFTDASAKGNSIVFS